MLVEFSLKNMGTVWVDKEDISYIITMSDHFLIFLKSGNTPIQINSSSYNLNKIRDINVSQK